MVPLPNFARPSVMTRARPRRSTPVPYTVPLEARALGPQRRVGTEPPPVYIAAVWLRAADRSMEVERSPARKTPPAGSGEPEKFCARRTASPKALPDVSQLRINTASWTGNMCPRSPYMTSPDGCCCGRGPSEDPPWSRRWSLDVVTRPEPLPIGTTSMRAMPGGGVEKFAVTSRSMSMVREQSAVPEHAPCHPAKVEPLAGTAVSRTFAFAARFCTHCALHSNAGSAERTAPDPLPPEWRVSVRVGGGANDPAPF